MPTLLIIQTEEFKQQEGDTMFRQSLIQVFKGLAEFHAYVPVAPAATETNKTTAACQAKQSVVSIPKQPATVSCC